MSEYKLQGANDRISSLWSLSLINVRLIKMWPVGRISYNVGGWGGVQYLCQVTFQYDSNTGGIKTKAVVPSLQILHIFCYGSCTPSHFCFRQWIPVRLARLRSCSVNDCAQPSLRSASLRPRRGFPPKHIIWRPVTTSSTMIPVYLPVEIREGGETSGQGLETNKMT